jgi:hypothetical protein
MRFNYGKGMERVIPTPRTVFITRGGGVLDLATQRKSIPVRDFYKEVEVHEGTQFFESPRGEVEIYVNSLGELYHSFHPYSQKGGAR